MLLQAMGINDVGDNSFRALQKQDFHRKQSVSQKVTDRYRKWQLQRRKMTKQQLTVAKEHYNPGGFHSKGEKPLSIRGKVHKPGVERMLGKEGTKKAVEKNQRTNDSTNIQITMPQPLQIIKDYVKVKPNRSYVRECNLVGFVSILIIFIV